MGRSEPGAIVEIRLVEITGRRRSRRVDPGNIVGHRLYTVVYRDELRLQGVVDSPGTG